MRFVAGSIPHNDSKSKSLGQIYTSRRGCRSLGSLGLFFLTRLCFLDVSFCQSYDVGAIRIPFPDSHNTDEHSCSIQSWNSGFSNSHPPLPSKRTPRAFSWWAGKSTVDSQFKTSRRCSSRPLTKTSTVEDRTRGNSPFTFALISSIPAPTSTS